MTPSTMQGDAYSESSTSTKRPSIVDRDKSTILTPQVSRILEEHLDDLSSSSGESDHSEAASQKSNHSHHSHQSNHSRKSDSQDSRGRLESPPLPSQPRVQNLHATNSKKLAPPNPHEHLARFHSLRSMLFSSRMADNESKWRSEHGERCAKPAKPSTKDRVLQRLDSGVHRLMRTPSHDLPPIQDSNSSSSEDDGSDEPEVHDYFTPKRKTEETQEVEASPVISPVESEPDDDALRHSDVEALVRHVSRPDGQGPPKLQKHQNSIFGVENTLERSNKEDSSSGVSSASTESDEEDFGHSEVDDLVKWVSKKPGEPESSVSQPI